MFTLRKPMLQWFFPANLFSYTSTQRVSATQLLQVTLVAYGKWAVDQSDVCIGCNPGQMCYRANCWFFLFCCFCRWTVGSDQLPCYWPWPTTSLGALHVHHRQQARLVRLQEQDPRPGPQDTGCGGTVSLRVRVRGSSLKIFSCLPVLVVRQLQIETRSPRRKLK